MTTKLERRAVYVPLEIWKKLDADAKKTYDTVTTTLKNVLLTHYNMKELGNNKSSTSTAVLAESTVDSDSGLSGDF